MGEQDPVVDVTVTRSDKERLRENPILLRVVMWLLFGVAVALVPLIIDRLHALDRGRDFKWTRELADGEIQIISAVLAAGAMGELVAANIGKALRLANTVVFFACFACAIVALPWYVDLT